MKLEAKLIAGGVLLASLALWWVTRQGNAANVGKAVGGAVVDLITGAAVGVGDATVAAANDPGVNPLQPLGSWVGVTLYDWTHSKASGGVW